MAMDDNTWKWAPILLLSPLPWAFISLVVMVGGQMVLNVALTSCKDPSGNTVDTTGMTTGLFLGITAAYIFLGTFVWTWLGHSVYCPFPLRQNKNWSWKKVRVLRPFSELRTVAALYGVVFAVSLCAAILLSVGVATAGSLCGSQTPLLLSFSSFAMIVYWVAIGITGGRLFTVIKGDDIRASLKEKGLVGGEPAAENDVDMVRVLFKQFDTEGLGHVESSELGAFLELLGIETTPEELQDIVMEIDKDGSGSITLPEFEKWYIQDAQKRGSTGGDEGNGKKKKKGKKSTKKDEQEEEQREDEDPDKNEGDDSGDESS